MVLTSVAVSGDVSALLAVVAKRTSFSSVAKRTVSSALPGLSTGLPGFSSLSSGPLALGLVALSGEVAWFIAVEASVGGGPLRPFRAVGFAFDSL